MPGDKKTSKKSKKQEMPSEEDENSSEGVLEMKEIHIPAPTKSESKQTKVNKSIKKVSLQTWSKLNKESSKAEVSKKET